MNIKKTGNVYIFLFYNYTMIRMNFSEVFVDDENNFRNNPKCISIYLRSYLV